MKKSANGYPLKNYSGRNIEIIIYQIALKKYQKDPHRYRPFLFYGIINNSKPKQPATKIKSLSYMLEKDALNYVADKIVDIRKQNNKKIPYRVTVIANSKFETGRPTKISLMDKARDFKETLDDWVKIY